MSEEENHTIFVTDDSSVHKKGKLDQTDEAILKEVQSGGGVVIQSVEQFKALAEGLTAAFDGCTELCHRYMTKEQAEYIRKLRVDEGYSWRAVARACHDLKWWPPDGYWDRVPSAQPMGMALCEVAADFFGEDYMCEPWNWYSSENGQEGEIMSYRCVGCDAEIGWNGEGTLCYTCRCDGHIFYNTETGQLVLPSSLIIAIHEKRDLSHLDYLIGKSDFTSPLKERLIEELKSLGAIWMKDCPQCLSDGTYQRVLDREKAAVLFEAEAILKYGEGSWYSFENMVTKVRNKLT
jgi:hypothetical protein